MKNIDNKKKIILVLSVIVLLAGIIVIATLGFNFDLRYQETKKVELFLDKQFEVSDIKEITNEVLDNSPVVIQKVEEFEDTVSIIAKDITDEQKSNLITKINEKYGTELSADTTEVTVIPHARGRDLIKPYIMPLLIATLIILVYMAIRYYKIGMLAVLLSTAIGVDFTQALLFSIIAITRIPVGRLTMPMMIVVYLLTLIVLTNVFENKLEKIKADEKKNKNK